MTDDEPEPVEERRVIQRTTEPPAWWLLFLAVAVLVAVLAWKAGAR